MCSLTISVPYDITVDQRCQFVKNKSYIYGLTLEEYPGMEKYVHDIQFFSFEYFIWQKTKLHMPFFFFCVINQYLSHLASSTLILYYFLLSYIINLIDLRWASCLCILFCLLFIGGRPNKSAMKSDMIMGYAIIDLNITMHKLLKLI